MARRGWHRILVVFVAGPDFECASVAALGARRTFALFARRDSASSAARTGNVLVVYVRHAFRVLQSIDFRTGRPVVGNIADITYRGRRLPASFL